jgi:hypothetical protein
MGPLQDSPGRLDEVSSPDAAGARKYPLAKRIGAWPSVAAVTAITVAAAELVTRATARSAAAR